jgi:hypothetical protein
MSAHLAKVGHKYSMRSGEEARRTQMKHWIQKMTIKQEEVQHTGALPAARRARPVEYGGA